MFDTKYVLYFVEMNIDINLLLSLQVCNKSVLTTGKINVRLMVFNPNFNNISVISWRSVLLVEETGGPEENHRPVTSH
jgi:hypothetical protein